MNHNEREFQFYFRRARAADGVFNDVASEYAPDAHIALDRRMQHSEVKAGDEYIIVDVEHYCAYKAAVGEEETVVKRSFRIY